MKGTLLTLFFAMLCAAGWAYRNTEVDGIYYNLNKNEYTAEVTSGVTKYSGSVIVPDVINVNGVSYSVTSIGYEAFANSTNLTSVTIPNSVTAIGHQAFYECSSLSTVNIPNSVTNIGYGAFGRCTSLPVEDNIRYADTYLIEAVDRKITSVNIKEGTKWIGSGAFMMCMNLTSVSIPNNVVSIGNSAFEFCWSLTSVEIPNSVTSIGERTFYQCTALTSVEIPNSVTSINKNVFSDCVSLTSFSIPNSVTTIAEAAFSKCKSLESIDIPSSVTSIGESAFWNCTGLLSVNIPSSVTNIGEYAFDWTISIKDVTVEWEEPLNVGKLFGPYSLESATLHVPVGTTDRYRAAETWKDFGFFEEYEPSSIHLVEKGELKKTRKHLHNGRIVITKEGKGIYSIDGGQIR